MVASAIEIEIEQISINYFLQELRLKLNLSRLFQNRKIHIILTDSWPFLEISYDKIKNNIRNNTREKSWKKKSR